MQLNQLVSGGNTTVTLSPENPTDIEVISMNSIIVKVELKDHTGPLQFTVNFEPGKSSDLTVSIHNIAKVNLDNWIK